MPARIHVLNQRNFPFPTALFEPVFSTGSVSHIAMLFVPDELGAIVFSCKTRHRLLPVFPDTPDQVIGHPGIQNTARSVSQNIDPRTLHTTHDCIEAR